MKALLLVVLLGLSAPASAEVVAASPNGFAIRQVVPLVVKPEVAFQSFASLPAWWNPEHSYSGEAKNLILTLVPGGCFCERFPKGGGIEHMRVTYVDPGKRILLTGSLGPLLYEATAGVLDIQVKSTAGGSQLTLDYKAAGFANGGADKLAPVVDQVLGEQMRRYRKYATARPKS